MWRAIIQNTIREDMIVTARRAKSHINITAVVLSNFEFPSSFSSVYGSNNDDLILAQSLYMSVFSFHDHFTENRSKEYFNACYN